MIVVQTISQYDTKEEEVKMDLNNQRKCYVKLDRDTKSDKLYALLGEVISNDKEMMMMIMMNYFCGMVD